MDPLRVGVVGAAGAVGRQLLQVLEERRFPVAELRLMATSRSAGTHLEFHGETLMVEETDPSRLSGLDLVFMAVGTEASRTLAPEAVRRGAVVIDKSNAFRMDPAVPLVVPEVNPEAARGHRGILASPNCSTIQLVVALQPLRRLGELRRVMVATYQSVSGTGIDAIEELRRQAADALAGNPVEAVVYPHPIAFNVIPHIDAFDEHGYSQEEMKLVRETRRILARPDLPVTATAVRVPVFVGHAEVVVAQFDRPVEPEAARRVLATAPGVCVLDEPGAARYPTPLAAAGRDEVFVGRLRQDLALEDALTFWVVADNLRKGAATNAVQIAELLWEKGWL